jgi:hypothetical protein
VRKNIRRAVLVLAAVIGLVCTRADAGIACSGLNFSPVAYDFESITVSNTALGFTAAKITPAGTPPAIYASCTLETNAIRYRADGLDPSATVGQLVSAGVSFEVCGQQNIQVVRFIRQTADGTLQCHYYRF